MELKKSFDLQKIFKVGYFVLLGFYLIFGLLPARASSLDAISEISIPTINLTSDVVTLQLENGKFATPDTLVGAFNRNKNKTFLVGHSSGVFKDLSLLSIGDEIIYDLAKYTVTGIETLPKNEIKMDTLLSPEEKDTLVIMTCAGKMLEGQDATERLIITASIQ